MYRKTVILRFSIEKQNALLDNKRIILINIKNICLNQSFNKKVKVIYLLRKIFNIFRE